MYKLIFSFYLKKHLLNKICDETFTSKDYI
jgi:hypothetical protein